MAGTSFNKFGSFAPPPSGGITAGAPVQPQAPSSDPNMMYFGAVLPGSSGSDFNSQILAAGGSAEAAPSFNPATGQVEWSSNLNYKAPGKATPTPAPSTSYPSQTSSGSGGSYSSFPSDGGGGGGAAGGGNVPGGAKIVEPPSMTGLKDAAGGMGGSGSYDEVSTAQEISGPTHFRQGIGSRIPPVYTQDLAMRGARNY